MKPPVPQNELERLRALQLFRVLDSGSEAAFDNLARLASAICETPISMISLIDENRQWFKSRVGVSATQTAREVAFCAHAINQSEVFVVGDASTDSRFAANPLVTSDPSIRFYAGAPLVVGDGLVLGTLCVIDSRPRQLTPAQLDALQVLRDAVVSQLELRRALADFRMVEQLLPLCAWCRNIRRPDGSWSSLYDYVSRTGQVTHGLCPDCGTKMEMA